MQSYVAGLLFFHSIISIYKLEKKHCNADFISRSNDMFE